MKLSARQPGWNWLVASDTKSKAKHLFEVIIFWFVTSFRASRSNFIFVLTHWHGFTNVENIIFLWRLLPIQLTVPLARLNLCFFVTSILNYIKLKIAQWRGHVGLKCQMQMSNREIRTIFIWDTNPDCYFTIIFYMVLKVVILCF